MDFSQNVMIDFGLNLAGYLIVLILVFLLVRQPRKKPTPPQSAALPTPIDATDRQRVISRELRATRSVEPAFVELGRPSPAPPENRKIDESLPNRQHHRRAIYNEARALLARGRTRSELLQRLPLTEDEIEILAATGNA